MGNKISKVKRSFKNDESYRALSACSDYESSSNSSVLSTAISTRQLASKTGFSQSPHTHNEEPGPDHQIFTTDCQQSKYPAVFSTRQSPDVVLRHSQIAAHDHQAMQPQLSTTIKSPVPISRLKLITTSPPPLIMGDKANVYKPSGIERSNDKLTNYQRKPDCSSTANPSYHHPPNGGYRASEQMRHSRAAALSPVSEQHRWAWRIPDTGNSTGQIMERHANALLREMNERVLDQLSKPLHPNEAYHIEVRVVKIIRDPPVKHYPCEPMHPRMSHYCEKLANMGDSRYRNQPKHVHANAVWSPNRACPDLTHAELAQLVMHNHERNNIQFNNGKPSTKRISSGHQLATAHNLPGQPSKGNKRRRKCTGQDVIIKPLPERLVKPASSRPHVHCNHPERLHRNFTNGLCRPKKGVFI
ncbi:uncharacterized protein LOC129602712 [Paramacrobiotus metropolitanus]|uniref:uncharacterized protein LOC129602712 n=1 Tax=Paramacrobiotus metropolitanus TaxID=2943436 RepID=UPI0024464CBE|nr:uncharacterized protein LOC129602712 [Paramacrobiotus metropolitanus]